MGHFLVPGAQRHAQHTRNARGGSRLVLFSLELFVQLFFRLIDLMRRGVDWSLADGQFVRDGVDRWCQPVPAGSSVSQKGERRRPTTIRYGRGPDPGPCWFAFLTPAAPCEKSK